MVWSHQTSEQFCWKAVTGMVWYWSMGGVVASGESAHYSRSFP
jgi:hypothetical protein